MRVTNFYDMSNNPVIDAIVATTTDEEQLLALFEDLTDENKLDSANFSYPLHAAIRSVTESRSKR